MTTRPRRAIMVWGTSSGAGKSLLATALCRSAARRGIDVVPFKAQNMSNNARVVPRAGDGAAGEIGSAQYFQALAARAAPHTDMNPVLLKPERDTASQVVVHGVVDRALSKMGWRERSGALAASAREGFERLAAAHELVVVEGAGSPAEINLMDSDIVEVSAFGFTGVENPAHLPGQTAILRFANGKAGKVSAAVEQWMPYQFNVDVLGTDGALRDNRFFSRKLPGVTGWVEFPTVLPTSGRRGARMTLKCSPVLRRRATRCRSSARPGMLLPRGCEFTSA
mgnify:CR=1 FL=1